jgi:hypothetical protein
MTGVITAELRLQRGAESENAAQGSGRIKPTRTANRTKPGMS